VKYHKLKILSTAKVEDGVELPVTGSSFLFHEDKVITYTIEMDELPPEPNLPDPLQGFLKEQERKKMEEEHEFVEKFQIKVGQYLYDQERGLAALPPVDEKFYETQTSKYLSSLFRNFFDKSDSVLSKFKKNKRAYLLYSDPGMGKSALIRRFCKEACEKEGTAIIQAGGDVDFQKLTTMFLRPYAGDVKRIILVIEDFGKRDFANNTSIYNPSCLNFLDGVAGLFRVPTLILCTTNFIRQLGPQLTNRPGRFNKLIKVLPPSDEEVFNLIKELSGLDMSEEQKAAFRGKEMTPDHIIEALLRYELENLPLEEAAAEVLNEREGLTSWN
jgi:hypothetical protein